MNNPTTTEITRTLREALRRDAPRRGQRHRTARPCQECGRNLPTTELTRSGHCPRCAQLTLTLEDSQ
jgi:predicted Zn-ribbon and HTH transcriptional regulator